MSVPTREQLLALQPGESLEHGGMRVTRRRDDPMRDRTPSSEILDFKRRYLEETATFTLPRDFIEDALIDPWEYISDSLDGFAAEKGMHRREPGALVVAPW